MCKPSQNEDLKVRKSNAQAFVSYLYENFLWEIRDCVVRNNTTPVEVLELLAKDKQFTVRRGVAKNKNVTPIILLLHVI